MRYKANPGRHPAVESVRKRFDFWRKTRKNRREPIPDELWKAAAGLAQRFSINRISKTLHLNYTDLKKRVHGNAGGALIKTDAPAEFMEMGSRPLSECVVEMEDAEGSKMRMCFRWVSDLDLPELWKAFWSKGR
jgi:hypothetical protein